MIAARSTGFKSNRNGNGHFKSNGNGKGNRNRKCLIVITMRWNAASVHSITP